MKNRKGHNIYERGRGEGCTNKDLSIYDGDKGGGVKEDNKRKV